MQTALTVVKTSHILALQLHGFKVFSGFECRFDRAVSYGNCHPIILYPENKMHKSGTRCK